MDGDVLVVQTRNFNGLTGSFGNPGAAYGDAKDQVLTERFTRTAYDKVDYEFIINDPSPFTDRIEARVPMTKVDGRLYEYACHGGN